MRTKNSILNIFFGTVMQLVIVVLGLISRNIFFMELGSEVLGINATLASLITMLSLTELGIGSAILVSLYKPIQENDKEKIKSIMKFYKTSYRNIAICAGLIGLLFLPFMYDILFIDAVLTISRKELQFIYLLFVLDMCLSYTFAYKKSLLFADQKNYIVNIIRTLFSILLTIVQVVTLIATSNFTFYIIAKIIVKLIENITTSIMVDKKYPYLNEPTVSLDKETKNSIFSNYKALAVHYIGNYLVSGTDMLIITRFLGLMVAGIYSNYLLVTTMVKEFLMHFSSGITASFGNIIACEEFEKLSNIFYCSFFIIFAISNTVCISLFVLFNSFIRIWIGDGYTFSLGVLFIIVMNTYFVLLSSVISALRSSAGLYKPDRYLHILLAIINLIISIGLVQIIGISGVFIGTLICLIIKEITVLPYIVFKHIFKISSLKYMFRFFQYTLFTFLSGCIVMYLTSFINVQNLILDFLIKGTVCVTTSLLILILFYRNTNEFKYFKDVVFGILKLKK